MRAGQLDCEVLEEDNAWEQVDLKSEVLEEDDANEIK